MAEELDYTGERMVPGRADPRTFWEHVYRYRLAANLLRGKRVLDIACGEGYGTAALQIAGASKVIGVDISEEACEHARRKYGVDARVGTGEAIPLDGASVEAIVSFETIEHVREPAKFLAECARVLVPGGMLIVSTPDTEVHGSRGIPNPFHISELTVADFCQMLTNHFRIEQFFRQALERVSWWDPRAIYAYHSLWERVRGFGRMRLMLQKLIIPHIARDVRGFGKDDVASFIVGTDDNSIGRWINPYVLRKDSPGRMGSRFNYAIVVATSTTV